MPSNLEQLEKLVSMIDSMNFSKEDFVKHFEQIVELVLQIKKENKEFVEKLETLHEKMMAKIEAENESLVSTTLADSIQELKDESATLIESVKNEYEATQKTFEAKIAAIDKKIAEVKNGKDADEVKIVEDVLAQIKLPEQKEIILDGAEEIANKLETLKGEKRLDKSAVKGWEEDIKKIEETISKIPRGRIGMRKVPIVTPVDLTSQVDGATRVFNVPKDSVRVLALMGTQFPMNFNSTDWTLAGTTLSLGDTVATPAAGQSLYCLMETLFYG